MRLLAIIFLVLSALRPIPVMAAMPSDMHEAMMGTADAEANHCDDQDGAAAQDEVCGACCLTVLPLLPFPGDDRVSPDITSFADLAAVSMANRDDVAEPPPPRA